MSAVQQTTIPGLPAQERQPQRRAGKPTCRDCGRPESKTLPLRRYLTGAWCVPCMTRRLELPAAR